ncbi:hypothetical protein N9212_02250 [Luminiphilus sp.]|jgi:UPF0716 family protein affecting phage T7 exclusion|nr:hypothetical protein [Luminiphilus sp.]
MLKFVAVGLSAGMFAFSTWVYTQSGDWVALLFMVLSAAYGVFFASGQLDKLLNRNDSEQ